MLISYKQVFKKKCCKIINNFYTQLISDKANFESRSYATSFKRFFDTNLHKNQPKVINFARY